MAYENPQYIAAIKNSLNEYVIQNYNNEILTDENPQELYDRFKDTVSPSNLKLALLCEIETGVVTSPLAPYDVDYIVEDYSPTPPISEPLVGALYIVQETGSQAFSGEDNQVAVYINTVNPYDATDATQWEFRTPEINKVYLNRADDERLTWTAASSGAWSIEE